MALEQGVHKRCMHLAKEQLTMISEIATLLATSILYFEKHDQQHTQMHA